MENKTIFNTIPQRLPTESRKLVFANILKYPYVRVGDTIILNVEGKQVKMTIFDILPNAITGSLENSDVNVSIRNEDVNSIIVGHEKLGLRDTATWKLLMRMSIDDVKSYAIMLNNLEHIEEGSFIETLINTSNIKSQTSMKIIDVLHIIAVFLSTEV